MKYTERKKARIPVVQKQRSMFRVHLIQGILVVFVCGILGAGIYYGTRVDAVTIQEITVSGGETISHELIESKVRESLEGTYAFLIPHTFSVFYPKDEIIERVSGIPRIHNVQVYRDGLRHIQVTFSEYEPYALWCVLGGSEPCQFIDANGYAYAEAPSLLGGALVRHMTLVDGDQFLQVAGFGTERFQEINIFVDRFQKDLGIRISEIQYKEHGDLELLVSGGGSLYVTLEKDLEAQFSHLATVLASKEFHHIEPGNFKYIDMRFDTKVFVNEKLGTSSTSSIATTTEIF